MEPEGQTKKRRVLAACVKCKSRKKKCDGKLPSCSVCQSLGIPCVYSETNLQVYQTSMIQQIDKINQLEDSMRSLNEELAMLKSGILNSQVNESTNYQEKLQAQAFVDPLLALVKHPPSESLYIGPSAVISKVHAIRKILTNDKDIIKNPLYQIKHKPIEEVREYPPAKGTEDLFVECYLTFSRNRYHFIEKSDVTKIFSKTPLTRDKWETFVTYIVLANGCRMAELAKLAMSPSPKFYFEKAFEMLGQLPVLNPMQQIQVCMSLALYLHYSYDYLNPFVMNVWELSGMAIRKMVQLGYHKARPIDLKTCIQVELEKRLFWSVYAFDRLLTLSLGRPASLPDSEIEVPFPLSLESVDEFSNELILQWQQQQESEADFKLPVTSITYLVETCRVRAIESRINNFAYGEKSQDQEDFNTINNSLEAWISNVPSRKEFSEGLRNEVPFDYLLLLYHRAKLFLLLPKITSSVKTDVANRHSILLQTLTASGGICKAFKKIQRDSIFGFSTFSLHTIFLAGVTLIYCIWAMERPPYIKAHNDLRACSNLLYSFSERASEAEIYRVLFENLAESILYNADVEEPTHEEEQLSNDNLDIQLITEDLFDDSRLDLNFTFDEDFWTKLDSKLTTKLT
ncbi:hypothetical protein PSN45_001836 [Yamadazyma tenuis]|uniref:Zn(2)-C6 fungal-type domain-containing protein n=1 Tax=Candida tenuis (strain ATCC 10573 / BCRC 21748 / CBS 615 / JCM 9827 / NBRC 10315 / NRRL Y-1498 / VKM Y-70) TaxID=590646 RepID=G3BDW9_CANTC|nr:uncharacterized protein CANTEDRAFT_136883 [Yamadazyma tenuis ATCC 10573]EGV60401.1 hypothetical protein CANTEDRAFT_136883 [Yamadazyma tenuis ATCC 10573]WEJ94352.1 hypothetical protein PSN45_001836 [Yamadazyma tenuis]